MASFVVESVLLSLRCGNFVVESVLWKHCVDIVAVESVLWNLLLWNLCCVITVVNIFFCGTCVV